MRLTDDLLRLEAEWMLRYIEAEWHGSKPHSRFARSLPLVLQAFLDVTNPSGVGQDATGTAPHSEQRPLTDK